MDPKLSNIPIEMKKSGNPYWVKVADELRDKGEFCANIRDIMKYRGAYISEYTTIKTEVNRFKIFANFIVSGLHK